jgi:hypothetical protein
MIFSMQQLFSNDQAVTVTAASSNVIDLGAPETVKGAPYPLNRDIGRGVPIPLLVQVTVAFATLTSLKVGIESSDTEAFGGQVDTVLESPAIPVAKLLAGYQFPINFIPKGVKHRYVRLKYTVAGSTATAGQVTAGITAGNQDTSVAGGV